MVLLNNETVGRSSSWAWSSVIFTITACLTVGTDSCCYIMIMLSYYYTHFCVVTVNHEMYMCMYNVQHNILVAFVVAVVAFIVVACHA